MSFLYSIELLSPEQAEAEIEEVPEGDGVGRGEEDEYPERRFVEIS